MKKTITFNKIYTKRKQSKSWNIEPLLLVHPKQQEAINQLFLNNSFDHTLLYQTEIKKKLTGYKAQDKKKTFFDINYFISLQNTIELLVKSKLFCYYCKKSVFVLYENIRDPKQWTLDRIDNEQGHNTDNCVICCLECNLQRRTLDDKKFKFTKQFKIIKKE